MSKKASCTQNIQYRGYIKVEAIRNGKSKVLLSQHNEGQKPLFQFIAYCLAGYSNDSVRRPAHIMLKNGEDNQMLRTVRYTSAKVIETTDNGYGVRYKFLIPANVLKQPETGDTITVTEFQLLNTNAQGTTGEVCATVNANNIKIQKGYDIQITWNLAFGNAQASISEEAQQ